MEALDMKDVKEFTGEKNKSAYVIVQDCVINVINSKPWKGSLPMGRYDAGADLTQGIPAAGISRQGYIECFQAVRIKLCPTPVVWILALLAFIWCFITPDILIPWTPASFIHLLLTVSLLQLTV